MSDDKLISIEGGGRPNVTAESVREAKSNQPNLLELMALIAEQKWFYFKELKNQGFSDKQALEIVTAPLV